MTASRPLRALVCPLDWGLGHAARCVPLIEALRQAGFEVAAAAVGLQARLIQSELPDLKIFPMPGYSITYSRRLPLVIYLLLKTPFFIEKYFRLRRNFLRVVDAYRPDIVISDNRPECWKTGAINIYITHQINLHYTKFYLLNLFFSFIHRWFFRTFEYVWVPDFPSKPFLSGNLGHPRKNFLLSPKFFYIGPLSRIKSWESPSDFLFDICFTLSGPEPSRSRWEEKILSECRLWPEKKFILIRGTNTGFTIQPPENIKILDLASSKELCAAWRKSRYIVCRSGYSTIMDLAMAGRTACLVPTPGQWEQEYLAQWHAHQGFFSMMSEKEFSLRKVFSEMRETHIFFDSDPTSFLPMVVSSLKEKLRRN
ncbi:MAG: hypothetical protein N2050_00940 [Flavobacteriales bacterium]|nr:hypothetical protein [Flavobacteriales bacterium]